MQNKRKYIGAADAAICSQILGDLRPDTVLLISYDIEKDIMTSEYKTSTVQYHSTDKILQYLLGVPVTAEWLTRNTENLLKSRV